MTRIPDGGPTRRVVCGSTDIFGRTRLELKAQRRTAGNNDFSLSLFVKTSWCGYQTAKVSGNVPDFSFDSLKTDKTLEIGVGLTSIGALFMVLGVLLFFDGSLLALGNVRMKSLSK